MDENTNGGIGDICTILGGTLLGVAIVDQVKKILLPQMEKLTSGEGIKDLKMLPSMQEKQDERETYKDDESESKDNEISELKRKLAELESKEKDQHE